MDSWVWDGSATLGSINLGLPFDRVIKLLPSGKWRPDEEFPDDARSGWWEDLDVDILVQIDDNRAVAVSAHKNFTYMGQNLIGMPRAVVAKLLGGLCVDPLSGDEPNEVTASTSLGVDLTFWDDCISSATISDYSLVNDDL